MYDYKRIKCKYCDSLLNVGELPDDEKIFDTCMGLPYSETHFCECSCGRATGSSIEHAYGILIASLDHDNSPEFLINEALTFLKSKPCNKLLSNEIYIIKAKCSKEEELFEIVLKLGSDFVSSAIQIIEHQTGKSHVFQFKDLSPICKDFLDKIFVLAEHQDK